MDRASDSGSEGWGFESLPACHVGANVISFAPAFFQKSERTHSVAPPFQITTAPPDCDLVGKRLSMHSCRLGVRRNKRHTVCPGFFQKSERTHSAAPPTCRLLRGAGSEAGAAPPPVSLCRSNLVGRTEIRVPAAIRRAAAIRPARSSFPDDAAAAASRLFISLGSRKQSFPAEQPPHTFLTSRLSPYKNGAS